ncbi:PAS domain S-box protein [Myxococcota bacterium]|nr:PAS domain S-box protein [Myxococcota bacterium]
MADESEHRKALVSELAETRKQLWEQQGPLDAQWLPDSALSDARYLFILEQIPAMLIEIGPDGKIEYVSPTTELIQGVDVEEALQEDWVTRVHPDDVHILIDFARKIRDPERSVTVTYRMRRKDGSWYWSETTSILVRRTEQGIRTIVFNRDVTDTKLAADALAESEQRYRMVVAASRDMIGEFSTGGITQEVSSNVEEQMGWNADELEGQMMAFDEAFEDARAWRNELGLSE